MISSEIYVKLTELSGYKKLKFEFNLQDGFQLIIFKL